MKRLLTLLATALLASACARPLPPPGGDTDRLPPRLIGTVPEPLAVVPAGNEPIVFRFDERISERNFSEAMITVSPLDGALRVDRDGDEIRIRIDGGWRPNRVYRVVVLPGVRDLFSNERKDAAELVFSTGPPVPNNAVAGIVLDRVTGRAAQNAVVTAVRRADTVTYMAVADTGGFFSLRHMPLGVYDVSAYSDQNRNRRRDSAEPVDTGGARALSSDTDTVAIVFNVLAPDSTPAEITRVTVVDSVTVRVQLDDYVAPDASMAQVTASLRTLPDSAAFAAGVRIYTAAVWDSMRAAAPAPRDSAATPDSAGVPRIRPPAGRRDAAPQARPEPLPSRELVLLLDRPLPPGRYIVVLGGITNLTGIGGGGGAESFEVRAAPAPAARPASPPPDTAAARGR